MRVRAICGDVLKVQADVRILVRNYHDESAYEGVIGRLLDDDGMMAVQLNRYPWKMRPATTLVLHKPRESTHYVFVQDDGAVPFRPLVSTGLMAACLHGCETVALSIHRSERRFPAVEASVEAIIEEVGLGYRAFEIARCVLHRPEISELIIVSTDESAVAQVEAAIRSGWPMK
jgi:hypothetical protein